MKSRTICALTLLFITTFAFSQLKVISNGKVGIGSGATSPTCTLAVGGDNGSSYGTLSIYGETGTLKRAVRVTQPVNSSASEINYGIVSQFTYGEGGYKLYSVWGNAYRGTTPYEARTYGVYGIGGNGKDGYNYGVFGSIQGERNGAAIFGSIDQTEPWPAIDDQYAGYFLGDVKIEDGDLDVDGTTYTSDINLKKDIIPVEEDVLTKLAQLQTISYKLKHPSEYQELGDSTNMERISKDMQSDNYTRRRFGLIAQELQTTFPEVVKKGSDGYLRVRYTELIPVLVQAINQQQQQIDNLKSQVENPAIAKGSQGLMSLLPESNSLFSGGATIQQNIPNPFIENTIIKYSIPGIESYAQINVYDLSGSQIKSYRIPQTGNGEIMIPGSELNPGLYIYNLIVDGVEIDSKRMILIE